MGAQPEDRMRESKARKTAAPSLLHAFTIRFLVAYSVKKPFQAA